jgi:hypothetical protein
MVRARAFTLAKRDAVGGVNLDLVSNDAAFITGEIMDVDGGLMMDQQSFENISAAGDARFFRTGPLQSGD